MANNFHGANILIGGATGALDAIDGSILADGDGAVVITATDMYGYTLDAASGASEDSPNVIAPDTNPGTKRWILLNMVAIDPTDPTHVATKNYVDNALGAHKDYFLSDDAGVGAYELCYPHETGEGQSTIVTGSLGTADNQLVNGWITEVGEPNTTVIRQGIVNFHFHAKKGASNHKTTQLYCTLTRYEADTTETLIATSGTTAELTDTETGYLLHGSVAADVEILEADRLICKIYANVGSGAVDAVVTIFMEGNEDSFFSTTISTGVFQTHGDVLDDLNTVGQVTINGEFLVGTGAGVFDWESGSTARDSLGLGASDTVAHATVTASNAPSAGTHLTNKDYVDSLVQGLDWQESVLAIADNTAAPPTEVTGDRYLLDATGGGVHVDWDGAFINDIVEFDGSDWIITYDASTNEGGTCWVEDLDTNYTWNGSAWVKLGSTVTHNNTAGLQGGTTSEYYHMTSAQNTAATRDATNSQNGLMPTAKLTGWDAAATHVSANGSSHSYLDQAVTIASTPTLAGLIIANGGTIGQAAGPLINFDDTNNFLEITGCDVIIGSSTTVTTEKFRINGGGLVVDGTANIDYHINGKDWSFVTDNTSNLLFSGGNATNAGCNITVFGGAHASLPNVFRIRQNGTTVLQIVNGGDATFVGGISANLKSGTDQSDAGAAAGELYQDTNDDNTVKIGV